MKRQYYAWIVILLILPAVAAVQAKGREVSIPQLHYFLFDPVLIPFFDSHAGLYRIGDRPQDPAKPYPYQEEDVYFPNREAGVRLAGTLTYPFSGAPFPAVVLISGSGAQDRNEEMLNHRPFLVLADYLTKKGIAVLRYDDRGVFESTGDHETATSADFAGDVFAAVSHLRTREDIDPHRIGLIGHSEGGMIAPMVAFAHPEKVAFMILMAGPGEPCKKVLLDQGEMIDRAFGAPESVVQYTTVTKKRIIDIVLNEPNNHKAMQQIREWIDERYAFLNATDRNLLAQEYSVFLSPWFRFFLAFDPQDYLVKVQCPVLAIGGDKDLQVPSQSNLQAIENALLEGRNERYKIVEFHGLNHLFQTAETGLPTEYETIDETLAPIALQTMGDWIKEITAQTAVREWKLTE